MPINELTASNLKWKNVNIGSANQTLTQELPDSFDVLNGAGKLVGQGTRQMHGRRLHLPGLFEVPPPANLPGAPEPLALGDKISWSIHDRRFVLDTVDHAIIPQRPVVVDVPPIVSTVGVPALPAVIEPPIEPTVSADALRRIGFRDVASWQLDRGGNPTFHDLGEAGYDGWRGWNPTLYAHCDGQTVCYIGKTTRLLSARMDDYRRGLGGRTDNRIHTNILASLNAGRTVHIMGFCPTHSLEWGGFKINLAAGLEDVLIDYFQPVWNA